ncbi:MAG: 2Fe-2S iron-sulfur cluster-binding protein [Proteobacteria bacterium]|nr:2Fe-2S iron-sulfur cluster-binding protein [Pseudomonadota bacterium]
MPQITFATSLDPDHQNSVTVSKAVGTKVLASALQAKTHIRYGCSAARCGTCAIEVTSGQLSEMKSQEKILLKKMKILNGHKIRLACQARLTEEDVAINLGFQKTYNPADSEDDHDTIFYH